MRVLRVSGLRVPSSPDGIDINRIKLKVKGRHRLVAHQKAHGLFSCTNIAQVSEGLWGLFLAFELLLYDLTECSQKFWLSMMT